MPVEVLPQTGHMVQDARMVGAYAGPGAAADAQCQRLVAVPADEPTGLKDALHHPEGSTGRLLDEHLPLAVQRMHLLQVSGHLLPALVVAYKPHAAARGAIGKLDVAGETTSLFPLRRCADPGGCRTRDV